MGIAYFAKGASFSIWSDYQSAPIIKFLEILTWQQKESIGAFR
jgi:hypothetical protein